VNLAQLDTGRTAAITQIAGSRRTVDRLAAMGIAPGAVLVKKSAALMKGPVVVRKGGMELAISHGMALKIMVAPAAPVTG
jgi:Fe2+ transport system protein FeoA